MIVTLKNGKDVDITNITDELCSAFIKGLDNADVDLSDFETEFVESNLERTRWSDKQKAVVKQLIDKFKGKVEY